MKSPVGGVLIPIIGLVIAPRFVSAQTVPAVSPAQLPRITQEVVVTATMTPASLESLGRVVTVLTREDLERLGLPSVVDALRLAPSVDVRARGPRDVQTDFAIRGATFGQSLLLVDGIRLNDSQSGHHNGDIPMAVAGIDRIEIVNGAASTVHGADALGGAINIISRTDRHATAEVSAGQFGYVAAQASVSGLVLPAQWTATGWGSHSRGFSADRDFSIGGGAVRGRLAPGWTVDVRRQQKAFGADGFYGPSPSKEWTDQLLAATTWHRSRGAWATDLRGAWRNHGDHFRWDINRPGFAENRHRTNSGEAALSVDRDLGAGRRLTLGGSAGGDWVRSTNLGDRDYAHGSGYGELQLPFAAKVTLQAGLRWDDYSTFGSSWSPAASFSAWVTPSVRLRAAVGHAFRIPTFTELYYHDPANLGSPDLRAERGWSVDGGADVIAAGWMFSASPFSRWDQDVIDWVRATPSDLWRSTNVRDVKTMGIELNASRRWREALVRASYTRQQVDAPALTLQSKYVLEYARDSVGIAVAAPVGSGFRASVTVDARARLDGQRYSLVGARLSRPVGRATLFLEVTNLLNETYHEVSGVSMPGRWAVAGISLR